MIHPAYNVPLTDVIGQEFEVGDAVLVPVRNRGGNRHFAAGGARLEHAKVRNIEPLFEVPGQWLSTGPDSRTPFRRVSQLGHRRAPEFFPPVICDDGESRIGYNGPVDLSKCSVVSVEYGNGTTGSFRYNGIVKVPTDD